jgi:hypothetical protein
MHHLFSLDFHFVERKGIIRKSYGILLWPSALEKRTLVRRCIINRNNMILCVNRSDRHSFSSVATKDRRFYGTFFVVRRSMAT